MCSYVTNRLSAGISSLAGSRVGSHRSLYARDVLRYIITFVMRVRGGCRSRLSECRMNDKTCPCVARESLQATP